MVAAVLGCTAPAPYYLAPGQGGAPGVRRILLCPPNLALALRPEISDAVPAVHQTLVAYLEARGLEVEPLDPREGRRRWREAVTEARRQDSPSATALFVQGLAEGREFQALMMPSLLLHVVRVVDNSGTWDGVRRRMTMVNEPSRGAGVEADTFTKGVAYGGISGDVLATSLHVLVFSPDGQRTFEGRGGLDFVQEIDLADAHGWDWQLRTKRRVLGDAEALREGVAIALAPFLPPRAPR